MKNSVQYLVPKNSAMEGWLQSSRYVIQKSGLNKGTQWIKIHVPIQLQPALLQSAVAYSRGLANDK